MTRNFPSLAVTFSLCLLLCSASFADRSRRSLFSGDCRDSKLVSASSASPHFSFLLSFILLFLPIPHLRFRTPCPRQKQDLK
ncbi:hypothetical protein B0I35DRAFT_434042 [Stachybotrys elegans]|uniref:Secreted peptide n=1 Tax=Stachybotrys elegans TaxID=80388 RepID=A0A8K0STP3_9HYPO|nr:hypothetical protein B0I35DRAFT_434042 [Stachybotrys elegans]